MNRLLLPLLLLLPLASCSLQATLTVAPDGSAQVEAIVQTAPEVRAAWKSLRELDASLPPDPLEPQLLLKGLGPMGRAVTETDGTRIATTLPKLAQYLPGWSTEGKVWEGRIDRATIRRWASLSAWSDSPALDSLLPSPDASVSATDYRDLLVYLLGSGVTEAAGRALVEASTVQLTLVAPQEIRSAPGAVQVNGRRAVYRWKTTSLLTTAAPIVVRLVF